MLEKRRRFSRLFLDEKKSTERKKILPNRSRTLRSICGAEKIKNEKLENFGLGRELRLTLSIEQASHKEIVILNSFLLTHHFFFILNVCYYELNTIIN